MVNPIIDTTSISDKLKEAETLLSNYFDQG